MLYRLINDGCLKQTHNCAIYSLRWKSLVLFCHSKDCSLSALIDNMEMLMIQKNLEFLEVLTESESLKHFQ